MTFEQLRIAVESRMAQWADAPIAFDGVPASPALQSAIDGKQPWVRLTINHGESFTASVSSKPETRRTGLLQLQIFTAENQGSRPAALLADSLADHFEYWEGGKLTTEAASVQRIGPSDGWYQYNVSVPFSSGC